MVTVDELLASEMTATEQVLTINWESRTIDIPKTITNLGVESDDDVKILKFRAPRHYHGTDLSEFTVRINYLNANKEGDLYSPADVVVTDDILEFSWVVGRFATMYKGDVEFNVCMIVTNAEGVIDKEINTTPSFLPVLEGLETVEAEVEDERDVITSVVVEALERAKSTDLKGDPGYTPVKGVDYFTPEEREEFGNALVRDHNGVFANALKGTVSGSVIRVDDVSPIEHTVKARVGGKNLLNDSVFKVETKTIGGVTCTANDDGSYTVSGENTSSSFITFGSNRSTDVTVEPIIPAGIYTPTPGITVVCRDVATGKETNQQQTFTTTTPFRIVGWYCYVSPNTSVLGGSYTKLPATFFPQLEIGSISTEYEPYIDPANVTVTACGKNLLPYPYDNMTKTLKGVTITENADGTFVANGTATGECVYFLLDNGTRYYKGKYTFSGISGGSTTTYYIQPVIDGVYKDAIFNPTTLELDGRLTRLGFYIKSGTTLNNMKFKLQIEKGDTATEYEPYVGSEYTTDANGSVDIVSVAPTMTLMTDTPGVTIEAEYSKDINCLHAAEVEKDVAELDNRMDNVEAELVEIAASLGSGSGSGSGSASVIGTYDPTKQLSAKYLASAYKAAFYASLPEAVADLNSGTIGTNADATADNAVCALYTDFDGNTCLTLLSNIELAESVTISADAVFRINGYTIDITCAGYAFSISGKVTIDGRVDGSSMKQAVSANSVNTALLHVPGDLNLLGGSFDVSSEEASKFVAGIANSGNTAIDGCSISATVNGGTAACYGINSTNTLKAHNSTISATSESEGGLAYSVSTTNKSVDMIMNGCKLAGRSNKTIVGVVIQSASDKPYEIINCDIEVTGAVARAINVVNSGIVENCLINTFVPGEGGGESTCVKNINNTSNLTIRNCTIFADGTTGSANDAAAAGKIASDGIVNTGTMTIENCTVFGTHTGVQCSGGSTTVINGGVYESCSHGGVYISCVGGNFYAQNATFKNVPYKGNHKDIYSYTQAVYMDSAVYIGGSSTSSDIKAYMDNCVMDGAGPCLTPDDDGFIGAEPIRFRGSLGEKNNHIYASNCTLMGDGQIRFANSSHRLYLGYGNRVLCEASIPSCVDSTTYAKKVFTSYIVDET